MPDEDLNTVTADIDDPDYVEPDDDDDVDTDDDAEKESTDDGADSAPDDDDDDKADADDPVEALRKEFEAKLSEKEKEINRLGYALRNAAKPKDSDKKGADEGQQFSDAQLLAILQEHKDDPTVQLQVMKEIARRNDADTLQAAEKASDIKTKRGQLHEFLGKAYPETMKEGTEQYDQVSQAVDWFHLDGHPLGRELAVAGMLLQTLPQTIQQVKEAARKEALAERADQARKKQIKNNAPGGTGDKNKGNKAPALSGTKLETAKMLFPNDAKAQARYAKLVAGAKGGGTYTASVQ